MLTYLASSTGPDIQYIVYQISRFSNNLKESHGKAIKCIGRYLKRTNNKGIIYWINKNNAFEDWVDADFASSLNLEDSSCSRSVLSRSGYIIKYTNCPIA